MKKLNKKGQAKGFTLTELVIVIVIIAILAAVLIPSMTGYVNRAKKANAQSEASSVYTVYAAWLADDKTDNSYYKTSHIDTYSHKSGSTELNYDATPATADGVNDLTYTCYAKYQDITTALAEQEVTKREATSLVVAFAKYYAAAQDITLATSGDDAFGAKALSADSDTVKKFYKVGKLSFVAAGKDGFYMLSSNGFGVLVTVSDGVPTYQITDKVVTSLGVDDKAGETVLYSSAQLLKTILE